MRLAILAVFFLAACTHNPKTWVPTRYSPPPGVTQELWETCWDIQEGRAMKLASYKALSATQKKCLLMRLTAACVRDTIRLARATKPELVAGCDLGTFTDAVDDTDVEQCSDPDEGESEAVADIYDFLIAQGRGRPNASAKEVEEMCPER